MSTNFGIPDIERRKRKRDLLIGQPQGHSVLQGMPPPPCLNPKNPPPPPLNYSSPGYSGIDPPPEQLKLSFTTSTCPLCPIHSLKSHIHTHKLHKHTDKQTHTHTQAHTHPSDPTYRKAK